jgi:hypothetical protein
VKLEGKVPNKKKQKKLVDLSTLHDDKDKGLDSPPPKKKKGANAKATKKGKK